MSFWNAFTDWFSKDRDHLVTFRIDESHVDGSYDDVAIESGRHYFRVTLVHMFLKKKNHFGKSWFPAAHSLVKCAFGNSTVEIPNIADTSKLFEQQAGTGDVVAKNFHLTPLMPFKGGTINLAAGLFAMEGEDYLNKVITVMSDFAGLLAVPQVSAALAVAGPLANGLQTLFGASDGRMHLGYHDSFVGSESVADGGDPVNDTPNYLREGYLAVVRAPAASVPKKELWVVDQRLRRGRSIAQNDPFTEYDYMLLHFELREQRDDYDQLDSITKPFNEAIAALGNLENEKAAAQIRLALVAALQSPDLTKADKVRVTDRLKVDYKKAKQQLEFDGLVSADLGSLLQSLSKGRSVTDALEAGLPTEEQVLTGL